MKPCFAYTKSIHQWIGILWRRSWLGRCDAWSSWFDLISLSWLSAAYLLPYPPLNACHTYKVLLYIAHPGVCCGCYIIGHQCCNVRLLLKTLSLSTYLQQFALNNPDTVQHLWGQSHRYIGRDSTDQVPVPGVDQRGTRPAWHRNHTMHSDSLSWIYLSK